MEVNVRDNNVEQALRVLKKKMQREGIYREMKMRRHFEKPSEKRVREEGEAVRMDKEFSYVSAWEYHQGGFKLHKEALEFEFVQPSVRSYK